jgi:hypothetical protein
MASPNLIWEALASANVRVVPKSRLSELAKRIDIKPDSAIRTLSNNRRIMPLFKGYYYLRTPDEILLHKEASPLDLFSLGAGAKDIGAWYFGFHTALRLNGMTHEHRTDEHVVSDSFYRPNGVPIAGRRFVVLKWRPEMARFGLVKRKGYFWSNPEKTVLDFAHADCSAEAKGRPKSNVWREHLASVDHAKLRGYLKHYPRATRALVEAAL